LFSDTTYQGHQKFFRDASEMDKKKLFWSVRRALNMLYRYFQAGIWLICPDIPSGWSWHLTSHRNAG